MGYRIVTKRIQYEYKIGEMYVVNSREGKHLHKKNLCFKCDKLVVNETYIVKLTLNNREYGSIFDSSSFTIQLCHGCMKPEYMGWFEEIPTIKTFTGEYKHENQIYALIDSFIIENQEYVRNVGGYGIDRQDWIDMEYGVLVEEKYEAYGMYSPKVIEAYEKRYSICQNPVNITYIDETKSSSCVFGSHGNYNQVPSQHISVECMSCTKFEERKSLIKEMTNEKFENFKALTFGKSDVQLYKDVSF